MEKVEIKKTFDIVPGVVHRGSVLLNKDQNHFITVISVDDVLKTKAKISYFEDGDVHQSDTKEFCYLVYEHSDDKTYLVSEITQNA